MARIHVVGLGPGCMQGLSMGSFKLLTKGIPLVLRTARHPIVRELSAQGITWLACDDLYEKQASFEEVYGAIRERLLDCLQKDDEIIYAVPGHPLVAEQTVRQLLQEVRPLGIEVSLTASMSGLEATYAALGVDPGSGLVIADALEVSKGSLNPAVPLLLLQLYDRFIAGEVKLELLEVYPAEWEVAIVRAAGTEAEEVLHLPLCEIDHYEHDHLTSLYIPACEQARTAGQLLEELAAVMVRLRAPEGCPWDLEQTHISLKPYLLEESYEVLEAIDQGDMHKLADELGDLLLQIVFHAQIAQDAGAFDLRQPVSLIVDKMKRRHPHVFGDVVVQSAAEVVENWQQIKAKERSSCQTGSLLLGVPRHMPALLQSYKLQQKAAQVGFDWPDISGAWEKVEEEMAELVGALKEDKQDQVAEELGDLLFAVVNVARFLGVEPETALLHTADKFRQRFMYIEEQVAAAGRTITDFTLEELDRWWNEAKKRSERMV